MDTLSWLSSHFMKAVLRRLMLIPRKLNQWGNFWQQYNRYQHMGGEVSLRYLYPILGEDTDQTPMDPIYFYQDAWAFEKITQQKPSFHVDVGSEHNFVAMLSKVVPVTMVDIRPLSLPMESIHFRQGSILQLPYEDASLESVSSICVAEHIGLGRYGDPLDVHGTEKALTELKRVVKPGGYLYVSLPLDDENRIYFNAHRAFSESYLEELFAPFMIVERRYIYGTQFLKNAPPNAGFGTGCYQLRRD